MLKIIAKGMKLSILTKRTGAGAGGGERRDNAKGMFRIRGRYVKAKLLQTWTSSNQSLGV